MWLISKIRTSVGLKMLLYLGLPAITFFLIFTSVTLSYVRDLSYRCYQHNAASVVSAVKAFVAPEDITNPKHFQKTAEKLVKNNNEIIKLHLHLARGSKVYTAASTDNKEIGAHTESMHSEPLKTGKDYFQQEGNVIEVHTPLIMDNKLVGVVGVYLSTKEEQGRINQLLWNLVKLGLLATALMTAVIYLTLSRTILRPLSRLERSTKKLALGAYETVDVDRQDELGQLAKQFNYMLNTIARKEDETEELYKKLERSYKQARSQAITDEITGLYNYRYFLGRLGEELGRSGRKAYPVSLAFIDIDNFKRFNDEFGHQDGDKALRTVADIIKSQIRSSDLAARYGGEEMVIIFPDTPLDKATIICERIRSEIQRMNMKTHRERPARLSVSIGLAVYPEEAASVRSLIHVADKYMYLAKKQGKNRVVASNLLTELPASGS